MANSLKILGVLLLELLITDFIYYVLYLILLMLHSAPPLCLQTLRVSLNADTSPIYLYIIIVKYENKIYLINFIYFYCTAT